MSRPEDRIPPPSIDDLFIPQDVTRVHDPNDPFKASPNQDVGWREFVRQFLPESIRDTVLKSTREAREIRMEKDVDLSTPSRLPEGVNRWSALLPSNARRIEETRQEEKKDRLRTYRESGELPESEEEITPTIQRGREILGAAYEFIPEHIRDSFSSIRESSVGKAAKIAGEIIGVDEPLSMIDGPGRAASAFSGKLFSRFERAIDTFPQPKGTGSQWLKHLSSGVPENERRLLRETLEQKGLDKIYTKDDIIQMKQYEMPSIGEVRYGHRPRIGINIERTTKDLDEIRATGLFDDWAFQERVQRSHKDVNAYDDFHILSDKSVIGQRRDHYYNADRYDLFIKGEDGSYGFMGVWNKLEDAVENVSLNINQYVDSNYYDYLSPGMNRRAYSEIVLTQGGPRRYKHRHWENVENPLAHLRMTTRDVSISGSNRKILPPKQMAPVEVGDLKPVNEESIFSYREVEYNGRYYRILHSHDEGMPFAVMERDSRKTHFIGDIVEEESNRLKFRNMTPEEKAEYVVQRTEELKDKIKELALREQGVIPLRDMPDPGVASNNHGKMDFAVPGNQVREHKLYDGLNYEIMYNKNYDNFAQADLITPWTVKDPMTGEVHHLLQPNEIASEVAGRHLNPIEAQENFLNIMYDNLNNKIKELGYKNQFLVDHSDVISVRHIDELQSDWAQRIRRAKGTKTDDISTMPDVDWSEARFIDKSKTERKVKYQGKEYHIRYDLVGKPNHIQGEVLQLYSSNISYNLDPYTGGIAGKTNNLDESVKYIHNQTLPPDMPFKNTDQWVDLGIERAIQDAIDNNLEYLTWSHPDMQYKLYGSELVRWEPNPIGLIPDDKLKALKARYPDELQMVNVDEIIKYFTDEELKKAAFNDLLDRNMVAELIRLRRESIDKSIAFKVQAKSQHLGEIPTIGNLEDLANQQGMNADLTRIVRTEEDLANVLVDILEYPEEAADKAAKLWQRMLDNKTGISLPRKEGFDYFYGTIVPKRVKEVAKKMGFKAEFIDVTVPYTDRTQNFNVMKSDEVRTQKALKITPEVKKSIAEKGYPIFGIGGAALLGTQMGQDTRENDNPIDSLFES